MKYLKELRLNEDEGKHSYGCVMMYFPMPAMQALHKIVDEADIYTDEESERSFGLESDPHVTMLYGLHDTVTDQDVFGRCQGLFGPIDLCEASVFENDDYDVLKMEAVADWLHPTNAKLKELPNSNDYPDYKPHCTIGYIKKGHGQKYVDMLKGMRVEVMPEKIVFSKPDGAKTELPVANAEVH